MVIGVRGLVMLQYYRMQDKKTTLGWGKIKGDGSEVWDTSPVFLGERVEFKDWIKLLFYPKKWMLYRWVIKGMKNQSQQSSLMMGENECLRILDVGCGTGASLVDFKKKFGRSVEVYGVDVVALQIDLAREKIKKNGVWAQVDWYDGEHLPFPNEYFDAIYTSDVLGHVENVPAWLKELNRVLKPGGTLAMFSESKLGRHAYVRNYLMKRGLNTDPHAQFHISLYSKQELKDMLSGAGFEIKKMYGAFWASFLVHPEEFAHELQNTNKHKFIFLKLINKVLFWSKKKTHPYSTALCELYGLIEMYVVGKWVEVQGYVILAKKK